MGRREAKNRLGGLLKNPRWLRCCKKVQILTHDGLRIGFALFMRLAIGLLHSSRIRIK